MPEKMIFQRFYPKAWEFKDIEQKIAISIKQLEDAGYKTELKIIPNNKFKDGRSEVMGEYKILYWMKAWNPGFCKKKTEAADPTESRQWLVVAKRQKKNKAEMEEWAKIIEQED